MSDVGFVAHEPNVAHMLWLVIISGARATAVGILRACKFDNEDLRLYDVEIYRSGCCLNYVLKLEFPKMLTLLHHSPLSSSNQHTLRIASISYLISVVYLWTTITDRSHDPGYVFLCLDIMSNVSVTTTIVRNNEANSRLPQLLQSSNSNIHNGTILLPYLYSKALSFSM